MISPRLCKAALAFCGLLSGCASTLVWTAKTPDRTRTFQVRKTVGSQSLFLDDQRIGRHDGIAVSTFAQGGGKWAYAARSGNHWQLFHTGGHSGKWDGIGEVVYSPSGQHLAFSAERQGRWHVVLDSLQGPPFDAILKGTFRFSPDESHFAYVARRAAQSAVVMDQLPDPFFDGVGSLLLGNGNHWAYSARTESHARVVQDGNKGPAYDEITELKFNFSATQTAYLARSGNRWNAVVEGFESRAYDHLHDLVFSPDGQFIAFAARVGGQEFVVKNGIADSLRFKTILSGTLGFKVGSEIPFYFALQENGKFILVEDGYASSSWDEIAGPTHGMDGKQFGFAARIQKQWHVLIDGREIAAETWAGPPLFGPAGVFGYVASRKGKMAVVVSGRAYEFDLIVGDSFQFSRDGNHWGCIAGKRNERDFFFVVDGVHRRNVDWREIISLTQGGASANPEAEIRGWVSAELELAIAVSP